MTDINELVKRLRAGLHDLDRIVIGGVPHDARSLQAADTFEAQAAEIARLREIVAKAPRALSDAFAAGGEERENGSSNRQEKYMQSVEELRSLISALQAKP